VKGITARRIIDYLKSNNHVRSLSKLRHQQGERNYKYSLWQTEKNVLPVFSESMFLQKVGYIHRNPVRARLVETPTEYRWSSARIWQQQPVENEPLMVDRDVIHWRR
jgi:REP element-mobilizing transposase RayT